MLMALPLVAAVLALDSAGSRDLFGTCASDDCTLLIFEYVLKSDASWFEVVFSVGWSGCKEKGGCKEM